MIKEFKSGDGCRFMCTCIPGSTSVFDMDVDDGVEVVEFEGFDDVSIGKVAEKSFPSVKTLVIGEEVECMSIPNEMFPNVKRVQSKSSNFLDGKYLIERAGRKLLNAFGQSEDAEIDFTRFRRIGNYAFEGCKAKVAAGIYEMRILAIQDAAFVGSGFLDKPFIGGIKCLGPFIIDIDETADEIILPKSDVYFCVPKIQKKCVRVPNINVFAAMRKSPKKVIIEDENIRYDDDLMYKLSNRYIEELESRVSRYKTVDGILYSADMKTLILCPAGKTGEVTIPDGVERIRKQAFFGSKISKVVFPDSLVRLQNEAFYGCENLKEIDFGNGIEQIGGAENKHIFSGCPVEKLIFPPQVKEIGISAFYSCGELKEIIFEEGLKYIREGAFKNCPKLTEVNLPESIKNVGLDAFVCEIAREKIQDININLTTIPKGLGRAIIHPGSMQTPRCVNVHVHNKNETFDFVIPDCVSATTNGYSEIVTGFNLMASDPEYFKKFHHLKWLNTAFMYAANSRFKYVCAYKTYKRTKNELAKEYLIDYQKMAADAIALELAEKDFVDFLRLEFINLGYDEDIVKCLEEQNWNVALAYMLNEEKEKDSTGNTFVI